MNRSRLLLVMCSFLTLTACATYNGGPTGQVIQCPDGARPMIDCRMAFDQYKRDIKLGLTNITSIGGAEASIGTQQLIQLDAIAGDLLGHKHQVCMEYNNCMISKEEYLQEQKYLRRAQIKIRGMGSTSSTNITIDNPSQTSEPPRMEEQSVSTTVNADGKKTAKTDQDSKTDTNVIFEELDSIGNKIEAARNRGVGVKTQDTTVATKDVDKVNQKVNIEYSLRARREKKSGKGKQKAYESIKFAPGATLRSGDQFKISFMTDNDGYVYVISFDSSGKSQIIFPHPEAGTDNKVKGGQTYNIPSASGSWYYLDNVKGKETLYVIASPFPISNLDNLVADLRQGKSNTRTNVKNARLRGSLEALTRGVGISADDKGEETAAKKPSVMTTELIEFVHK